MAFIFNYLAFVSILPGAIVGEFSHSFWAGAVSMLAIDLGLRIVRRNVQTDEYAGKYPIERGAVARLLLIQFGPRIGGHVFFVPCWMISVGLMGWRYVWEFGIG